jgi:dTDP-glucose 4,6-dehydratase
VNRGYSVLIIDKITYASNINAIEKELSGNNAELLRCDICDAEQVSLAIKNFTPESIVNFAAESHVDRSIAEPRNFIQTNILGTFELLKAATKYWQDQSSASGRAFRFHHISTDEVYGDLPHPDEQDRNDKKAFSFTEKTAYKPSSPYSASKAAADHLVNAWARTYGLPVTISNCSNNYGPFQHREKLVPKTIFAAATLRPIPVYGNGRNIRDWLYVEDHVNAVFEILEHGTSGETYNIGARAEYENISLVSLICDLLETQLPIAMHPRNCEGLSSYKDLIKFVADRPGHDTRYAINPTKIEKQLGWSPLVSLSDGMLKTINHYLTEIDIGSR